MIPEIVGKCKTAILEHQKALGTIACILLGIGLILGLARLAWDDSNRPPIRIEDTGGAVTSASASSTEAGIAPTPPKATSGVYVASKSGTRYYLPTCGGVSRIKEANKVWFQTKAEAEARGYLPAAACKGI